MRQIRIMKLFGIYEIYDLREFFLFRFYKSLKILYRYMFISLLGGVYFGILKLFGVKFRSRRVLGFEDLLNYVLYFLCDQDVYVVQMFG